MNSIRNYLLGRGEQNAAYPQSIIRLQNSSLECYGISNQYEDSYEYVDRFVKQYRLDISAFAYDSKKISAIPSDSMEVHDFFAVKNNCDKQINVVACFNAIKNQDLLRYIDSQKCVKNIYILDGFTYRYDWKNGSWEYRDIYISRKLILVDSSCPYQRRITSEFLSEHEHKINETFLWLEDDLSRRTMTTCFDGYISLQDFAMSHVLSKNDQYFDEEIIEFDDNEVFVDCGAFVGDSVVPFVHYCKNRDIKYRKIFAFEPDQNAYESLKQTTQNYRDVYTIPYGIGDKSGQYYLNTNFGSSKFIENSIPPLGYFVQVTTIDEYLKCEKISFIKMDLEGGEMDALRGAKNTIAKYHPKLAICIYHKPEDWITIPQYIKSLYSGYKFYCRGYFNSLKEIVLYAV